MVKSNFTTVSETRAEPRLPLLYSPPLQPRVDSPHMRKDIDIKKPQRLSRSDPDD